MSSSSEALIAARAIIKYVNYRGYEDHPLYRIGVELGGFQTTFTRECKFCGLQILLDLLINGRWQVQNLDNTLHQCVRDRYGTPMRLGAGAA